MIKGSSSKRRGSSEATSQTMPRERTCKENAGTELRNIVCQTTHSTSVKKDTERRLETKPDKEIGVYEPNFDPDCEISEKQVAKDQIIEEQITKVKKRLSDVQNKKSLENIDGKCKSENVVVPKNVRKHLNKDSSPNTDGCTTSNNCSPVNTDKFTKYETLVSSPKRKTVSSKKKKSPRKRTEESLADSRLKTKHSRAKLPTNLNKTDIPVKDITNEKLYIEKQIMEHVEMDNDIVNTMILKSASENLDTPSVNSSEQSILEHKLTALKTAISTGSEATGRSDLKTLPKDEHMEPIVHDSVKSSSQNISHTSDRCQQHMGAETVAANGNDKLDATGDNVKHERLSPGVLIAGKITHGDTMDLPMGDNINTCSLTPGSLLAGKITPVVVSEVVSPWCFFLQQNGLELNQLMEEICIYMSQGGLMKPSLLEPVVGTVCLAKYSKDLAFYRAIVTHTYKTLEITASEADVLYVDYGNRERVKVTQLRPLPQEFTTLPTQAICCALAEVMPYNKYCVWTEDDIHLFRQYVAAQQLSCTPPMCRSSGASLPLLVELIASYPVPAGPSGSMYISQFSIAELLIKDNKARHVELPEQIGLLAKSGEGAEEAAILSHNMAATSRLAITELEDNHYESCTTVEPVRVNDTETTKPVSTQNTNITEAVSRKDIVSTEPIKDTESAEPDVEKSLSLKYKQASADPVIIEKIVDISNLDDASKQVKRDLISPRLENSDTESQRDEGTRGSDKSLERGHNVTEMGSSRGHLDKIKEEVPDLESYETASTTTSHATDLDFPPEQLSDLHFDLDDLSFNPHGQEVMLAHVKSPDDFYVHIISQQSGETLDRLMKSLNMLFEKTNRRKLTRLSKTFESEENKLCCAQFLQDNNFYRGIILSTKPEKDVMKGRVLVHYIDFGDEEWLPRRRIFPLPPQLCTVPRLALRCSLSYIKPVCTMEWEPAKWSNQSVEKFVDIAGLEKTLHMHVVHGSLEQYTTSGPSDEAVILGILLVDNTGTEEVCINMDLIREGVAQLDTSQTKPDRDGHSENPPERLETWNPMQEDFLSKRNSYKVDTDDVGVATTGYKARDEETICKFYSSGRRCWRGDRCTFRHVKVESGMTYDKEQVYAIVDNQSDFIPHCGSWVAMEISTILSPSHFYAILPMGNRSLDGICSEPEKSESAFGETGSEETLDDLLAALNTEYSKRPAHEGSLLLKAMGEVVVARFSADHQWYRARVVEVTEEKVKVFFVDFGNTEWLPEEEIADMKPEFLHLPFQAIECFLNVEPKGDENWSKDARVEFRELVDGKTLVGNVRSRSWNGCLWVELFDTSSEDDVNIGDVLVDRGHAVKTESHESHTDFSSNFSEIGQRHSTTDIKEILVPG